jgi:ABC-type uncharacterized transport system substrate-binding protein
MKRRDFLTLLGGAAASWPCSAWAQQPSALPLVGFVTTNTRDSNPHAFAAFRQGLEANGFIAGKNVAVEYHWAEGHLERLPTMVMELVRRGVSVLVAGGGDVPALVAKGATATIPIVFLTAADPVRSGLVTSLNRPDRNATGATLLGGALGGKRLELLNELVPKSSLIGVLANENNPNSLPETNEIMAAARSLGHKVHVLQANNLEGIERAFTTLSDIGAAGLLLNPDPNFMINRTKIIALAKGFNRPIVYYSREYPESGGLLSYGSSFTWLYRQAADYVARILRGAAPAELPVVQPTRFDLVVNLKAARSLGLNLPTSILVRADEVIE